MIAKVAAIAILLAGFGTPAETGNPLIGTWKLVSYTDTSPDGKPFYPFGAQPRGQFVFTADGHFSAGVQCDENGSIPAVFPVPEFDDLTRPYMGYFGRYALDPATGALTWNVDGSSAPSYVGSSETTSFSFNNGQLVLKGTSVRKNGHQWTWERVLARG